MFWLICWILGFLGCSFLLFSLILSRRRYKGMIGFKPNSLRYGRNIFFALLSFLILNTIFFERLISYRNVYYVLSLVSGFIGFISIILSIWVLMDAHGKAYKELSQAINKIDQSHKTNESIQ